MKVVKKRRIFILSFFILIWGSLFFYGYDRYQELHTSDEELVLFDKQFDISNDRSLLKSSSIENEVPNEVGRINNLKDSNFFGSIANADENSLIKKDSEIVQVSSFDDVSSEVEEVNLCGNFQCYTGDQFVELYNKFEQNLVLNRSKKQILGNEDIDQYIRNIAEKRGYKKRVFANQKDIIDFNGMKTRLQVKKSYLAMRDEMAKQGIHLHFVSGYRSAERQRGIFLRKLGNIDTYKILDGFYDNKIDEVLMKSSIPGYSKHHSGYTVDFGCGNDYLVYSFSTTKCYKWMSENNFENTKKFGFIPSYPNGVDNQGPNPEPWEFVWVGVDNIK